MEKKTHRGIPDWVENGGDWDTPGGQYWQSQMEPQGTERYFSLESRRSRTSRGDEIICRTANYKALAQGDYRDDSCRYNIAGSFGEGYLVQDDALWRIKLGEVDDPRQTRCLRGKLGMGIVKFGGEFSYIGCLVKNPRGLFVIDKDQVQWLTLEGEPVKVISFQREIDSPYLCGILLYYLSSEKNKDSIDYSYSAYLRNLETGKEICIVRGFWRQKRRQNGEKYERLEPCCIYGNERGAVLGIEGGIDEKDFREWFYFDFHSLYCLSSPQINPLSNWSEYVRTDWRRYDAQRRNIMAFDMEKNIMWVSREPNGRGGWEAMTLEPAPRRRGDLPVWQLPAEELRKDVNGLWNRVYFDGEVCYAYTKDGRLCAFDRSGGMEEWGVENYRADMMVLKDCIRVYQTTPGMPWEGYFAYFPKKKYQGALLGKDKTSDQALDYYRPYLKELKKAAEETQQRRESAPAPAVKVQEKPLQAAQPAPAGKYPLWPYKADPDSRGETFQSYWEGFRRYFSEKEPEPDMKPGNAMQTNFYYINLRVSILYEIVVNKGSLKVQLDVKNCDKRPESRKIFGRILAHEADIRAYAERELGNSLGQCKATSPDHATCTIALLSQPYDAEDVEGQYEWLYRAVMALHGAVKAWLD